MTKKPARNGRPPIPKKQRRTKVFGARLRADEEREVLTAIKSSGLEQGDWIRKALLDAARRAEPGAQTK